jgi:hypothetical protein
MKRKIVKCPYCKARATLRSATVVYGDSAKSEYLFVCSRYPKCDSYVGAHKKTKEPFGTLADKNLRLKRIQAHRVFNQLWERGFMSKAQAYKWAQSRFGLNSEQTHIGLFSEYMCSELIRESEQFLRNNGVRR